RRSAVASPWSNVTSGSATSSASSSDSNQAAKPSCFTGASSVKTPPNPPARATVGKRRLRLDRVQQRRHRFAASLGDLRYAVPRFESGSFQLVQARASAHAFDRAFAGDLRQECRRRVLTADPMTFRCDEVEPLPVVDDVALAEVLP